MNGNSQEVVKLLSEKIDRGNEQLNQRIADLIVSNKEVNDSQQKLLNSHCERIRRLEEDNVEMRPAKKFYNQIKDYALGLIIFLGGTVILAASWIKAHLT